MIILILLWIICGIYAYGITYGYFQKEFSIIARQVRYEDGFIALLFAGFGIIGLIASYFLSGFVKHGLKYIDRKGE